MRQTSGIAPYYNANVNSFNSTTWVATVAATATALIMSIQVWYTGDQMLEWGYTAGTGNTHAGYILGQSLAFSIDFPVDAPFLGTFYVRKKAGGSTPTAGILLINAIGAGK